MSDTRRSVSPAGTVYCGVARTEAELTEALSLVGRVFQFAGGIEATRRLTSPERPPSPTDAVIVSMNGTVSGACFMVPRQLYDEPEIVPAMCLTAICIDDRARGQGLSVLLMEAAIAECSRRGVEFAFLSARRAVDHFYNRFGFWGLAQYARLSMPPVFAQDVVQGLTVVEAIEEDLAVIAAMYAHTYRSQYGALVRSPEYWRFCLWNARRNGLEISVVKVHRSIVGYWVRRGTEVLELGALTPADYSALLAGLAESLASSSGLTLHCTDQHPVTARLGATDYSASRRQCSYGGHMIRVIDERALLERRRFQLRDRVRALGIRHLDEDLGVARIVVREEDIAIVLTAVPTECAAAAFLIDAATLGARSSGTLTPPRSFNLLGLDEV